MALALQIDDGDPNKLKLIRSGNVIDRPLVINPTRTSADNITQFNVIPYDPLQTGIWNDITWTNVNGLVTLNYNGTLRRPTMSFRLWGVMPSNIAQRGLKIEVGGSTVGTYQDSYVILYGYSGNQNGSYSSYLSDTWENGLGTNGGKTNNIQYGNPTIIPFPDYRFVSTVECYFGNGVKNLTINFTIAPTPNL